MRLSRWILVPLSTRAGLEGVKMTPKEIKQILSAMVESEVSELTLETADYKLNLRRSTGVEVVTGQSHMAAISQPAAAPEATVAQVQVPEEGECPGCVEIKAPIVGTFYRAPAPDAEPYVQEGDRVSKAQVLCIIEAMKLMNEIEAETAGTIRQVLVQNAEPVEFGQPLFLIEPI